MSTIRTWRPTLSLTFALILCGCGGGDSLEKFPVAGKVSYKGEPVQEGDVNFRNETHGAGGAIDPTGSFTIEGGLPAGTYSVYITPAIKMDPPTFGKEGKASPKPPEVANIPQKYRLPATSGFEITVKSEPNENIELKME